MLNTNTQILHCTLYYTPYCFTYDNYYFCIFVFHFYAYHFDLFLISLLVIEKLLSSNLQFKFNIKEQRKKKKSIINVNFMHANYYKHY